MARVRPEDRFSGGAAEPAMPLSPTENSRHRAVAWLQPQAPAKPPLGAPCNGCGLCCLAEPCPLGMWLSRRRHGACAALRWSPQAQRYQCGALSEPASVTGWRSPWLLRLFTAMARRWIAAGKGCDTDLSTEAVASPPQG